MKENADINLIRHGNIEENGMGFLPGALLAQELARAGGTVFPGRGRKPLEPGLDFGSKRFFGIREIGTHVGVFSGILIWTRR